jgi:hypothetical protein
MIRHLIAKVHGSKKRRIVVKGIGGRGHSLMGLGHRGFVVQAGASQHHLAGHARHIRALPADAKFLDQGDRPSGRYELRGDYLTGGPGSEDNNVELIHLCHPVPVRKQRSAGPRAGRQKTVLSTITRSIIAVKRSAWSKMETT